LLALGLSGSIRAKLDADGAAPMSRAFVLIAMLFTVPAGAAVSGVTATNTCPIFVQYHGRPHARVLRHLPAPPPPHHRRRHR
jgi:hypothetical protein